MLGVRASAAARSATRQFLIDQFRDINLVAQLHDYGSGQNVHATLPATTGDGDHVVFGAHFDTVAASPAPTTTPPGWPPCSRPPATWPPCPAAPAR
jgi:acetylornithine deacetylase/succinyl-diaminopimelate desuccinylase-like protein